MEITFFYKKRQLILIRWPINCRLFWSEVANGIFFSQIGNRNEKSAASRKIAIQPTNSENVHLYLDYVAPAQTTEVAFPADASVEAATATGFMAMVANIDDGPGHHHSRHRSKRMIGGNNDGNAMLFFLTMLVILMGGSITGHMYIAVILCLVLFYLSFFGGGKWLDLIDVGRI